MTQNIDIENLSCLCSPVVSRDRIAYILYPMDMLREWIEPAARKYGVTIVAITDMDWQNVFSPWPAPGVPKGSPDFRGESPQFLKLLQQEVIPHIESSLGINSGAERTLVGVSMSGLFALWQWMVCGTFRNIASLSGSFWYEGFIEWFDKLTIPRKPGFGYFLLGTQEPRSGVKAFSSVGVNTGIIVGRLRRAGIDVEYQSVPGNHYSDPLPRLNRAFTALFSPSHTH